MESQENVSFSIINDYIIVNKYFKRYIKSIITSQWITHQKDTKINYYILNLNILLFRR